MKFRGGDDGKNGRFQRVTEVSLPRGERVPARESVGGGLQVGGRWATTCVGLLLTTLVLGLWGCYNGHPDPQYLIECGDHCRSVPEFAVSESLQSRLAPTTPGMLCVPDRNITEGGYVPKLCESLGRAEGRCLAVCIPAVAPNAQFLPRDVCWAGEVCVPCVNPISKTDTGACTIAGDKPHMQEPKC